MTVKELLEKLQKCDPEMLVTINFFSDEEGVSAPIPLRRVQVVKSDENEIASTDAEDPEFEYKDKPKTVKVVLLNPFSQKQEIEQEGEGCETSGDI
jgi:hypothetical protein